VEVTQNVDVIKLNNCQIQGINHVGCGPVPPEVISWFLVRSPECVPFWFSSWNM